MADVEAVAEVGASLSPDSLTALSTTIAKALDKGFADFGKRLAKALKLDIGKIQKDAQAGAAKLAQQYDRAARSAAGVGRSLKGADRETVQLIKAMERLAQSQQVIEAAVKKSGIIQSKILIDLTKQTDRANQARIESARNAAKIEAVELQGSLQRQVVAARFAGQQRVQITRAVIENIARLERGLAATIAGIARTAVGATGRVYESLAGMLRRGSGGGGASSSSFTSSIRRMNSELNREVNSSLSKREMSMRQSFMRQERILMQSATRQSATLATIRRQTSTGLLGAATGRGIGPGLGVGIGAGVGVGALLTSGFARFSDLERLTMQFTALTGSAEKAAAMLAQVKEFAKLTPFDLVGVADLAKGMLTIGTAVDEVMPRVKILSDAVAFTGGGVDAMDRLRRAISQVISTGRLQGDELNQLAENLPGLNIIKILANQLTGGDTRLLMEMKEAGEISSDMFLDGLLAGLGSDPRLVGASEDLAKTLSGRVANLKESFADLGASLIGLVAGPLRTLILSTQTGLQSLSDFVKGENLGAAMETLRTALGGVAAGLSAVLAARGAVEVFGLLARSASLLLTPFGMIATSAGLIGGAIAVMVKHNDRLREAFSGLGDRIGEVIGRIRDALKPAFELLSSFINATVIPAISRFAEFLANNLVGAVDTAISWITDTAAPAIADFGRMIGAGLIIGFRAAKDFVTNVAIPALKNFVGFLRSEVFPVAADVGRFIADKFMAAVTAVANFGRRIRPYVQPAIDAFKALGDVIRGLFTDDVTAVGTGSGSRGTAAVGGLGGAISGVASGIAASLDNVWDAAFEKLREVGKRLVEWLKGVFSLPNLKRAWSGLLDGVEWLGRQIGTILSSPTFLKIVAGAAAGLAIIGFTFVKGIIEGIYDNLPELAGMLLDALKALFSAAFSLEGVGAILIGSVVFTSILKPLIARFRSAGAEAGSAFGSGLMGRLGRQGVSGFAAGVLGGPGSAMGMASSGSLRQYATDIANLQNRLRIFGSTTTIATVSSEKAIAAARREVGQFEKSLTAAQIRGLEFRDRMVSAFRMVGATITGAGGILKGVGQLGAALGKVVLGAPLNVLAKGIQAATMPASAFGTTGLKWGMDLSSGFRAGFQTIKTAWTEMMATLRAEAAKQGTTAWKAMGAGAAKGFAVGFGGFLTGKFMGEAGMSPLTSGLTGAITGGMVGGGPGAIIGGVSGFIGGLLGRDAQAAKDARERVQGYAEAIRTDLADALKETGPLLVDWNLLLQGGESSDLRKRIVDELEGIIPTLNDVGISVDEVVAAFQAGEGGVEALAEKIRSEIGDLRPDQINNRAALKEWQRDYLDAADEVVSVFDEIGTAIDKVNERELFLGNLGSMGTYGDKTVTGNIGGPPPGYKMPVVLEDAKAAADAFFTSLGNVNTAWDDLFAGTTTDLVAKAQLEAAKDEADAFYLNLRNVNSAWDSLHGGPPLSPEIRDLIDENKINDAAAAYENLGAKIRLALTGPETGGTGDLLRDLILGARGGAGALNLDGVFDDLELSALRDDLIGRLSPVLQQAVTEGWQVTPEAFEPIKQQLITAMMEGVDDPTGQIKTQLEGLLAELQQSIVDNPLTFAPALKFDEAGMAYTDFFGPGGAPKVKVEVEVEKIDTAKLGAEQKPQFRTLGGMMGLGVTEGLRGMIPSVEAAARDLANKASLAIKTAMQISSPSKVMIDLGQQIGLGLAKGIESTEETVTEAIDRVVGSVLDSVSKLPVSATLFDRLVGSGAITGPGGQSPVGFTQQVGGFTQGMNSLMSTFASNVQRIFDVASKKVEERTAADNDIFGESAFSLSVFDVLGASNFEAFTSVFDQIKEMGVTLFAEGKNVTEVLSTITSFRDKVLSWGEAVGFSAEQLHSLVDSLGLSDSALVSFVAALQQTTGPVGYNGPPLVNGMTEDQLRQLRSMEIEALTLSPEDLAVFVRENKLGYDFVQKTRATQADIADNSEAENREMGRALGLWGDALDAFVARLEDWLEETGQQTDKVLTEIKELPQPPISVAIHPPHGDPVAIGLAAGNRVAQAARLP